jgi:hypothetical protein
MKKILMMALLLVTAYTYGQDVKSMMKSSNASSKLLNNDFLDKMATDQLKKLTKKLNLSEDQQKQASSLVMNQLRSEKFQKVLSKYTPDQLMSPDVSDNISKILLNDESFGKELNGLLNKEQQSKLASEKLKLVN